MYLSTSNWLYTYETLIFVYSHTYSIAGDYEYDINHMINEILKS